MRKQSKSETKTLNVKGFTWGGQEATYSYDLSKAYHRRPGLVNPPTTLDEAKKIAGDFESLTSASVVTVKTTLIENTTVKKLH